MCPRTTGLISATRWTASNRAARRSAHSARSCKPCDNKCRSGRLNRFFLAGHLGVILRDVGAVSGKVVTTFHGYDIRWGLERGSGFYSILRRYGDCYLAISKYNRARLEKLGFDPSKIVDHPVGIDTKPVRPPICDAPGSSWAEGSGWCSHWIALQVVLLRVFRCKASARPLHS